MHILSIFTESNISPAFVRANLAILKKYQSEINSLKVPEKKLLKLKTLWKIEYNADFNNQNNTIEFNSESDLTMFLVRWG